MSTLHELPPVRREAAVVVLRGHPHCGACKRRLAARDAWRCPWVACRAWLRSAGELDATG